MDSNLCDSIVGLVLWFELLDFLCSSCSYDVHDVLQRNWRNVVFDLKIQEREGSFVFVIIAAANSDV